jgi:hypothetical protein
MPATNKELTASIQNPKALLVARKSDQAAVWSSCQGSEQKTQFCNITLPSVQKEFSM